MKLFTLQMRWPHKKSCIRLIPKFLLVTGLVLIPSLIGNLSFAKTFPKPALDSDFFDNGTPLQEKVELGKLLFFDKILSGNLNISCATCHHALTDTGDGLSLPVGEGGRGLGMTRDTGVGADAVTERVPRNAPPLFNLGAREFDTMFADGRVQVDSSQPSGFRSPAGNKLPLGLDNVLAAQAMFPVTSGTEMAGQSGENPIADAATANHLAGPGGVWEQLANRLRAISDYVNLFQGAFSDITTAADITFVHAANAIAAFEAKAWRADNSPFDQYLRGKKQALTPAQKRGMAIFYGKKGGCHFCHSGVFQTDQAFHAIGMPQIGPGKGDGFDGHEDFGRERVTEDVNDRYRFRTPSLRNVVLTGPWGHDGAFNTLRAVVEHHLNPENSLLHYETGQTVLPARPDLDAIDFLVQNDPSRLTNIAVANELRVQPLKGKQLTNLLEFLLALTDTASLDLRNDVPKSVPSNMPMGD